MHILSQMFRSHRRIICAALHPMTDGGLRSINDDFLNGSLKLRPCAAEKIRGFGSGSRWTSRQNRKQQEEPQQR